MSHAFKSHWPKNHNSVSSFENRKGGGTHESSYELYVSWPQLSSIKWNLKRSFRLMSENGTESCLQLTFTKRNRMGSVRLMTLKGMEAWGMHPATTVQMNPKRIRLLQWEKGNESVVIPPTATDYKNWKRINSLNDRDWDGGMNLTYFWEK